MEEEKSEAKPADQEPEQSTFQKTLHTIENRVNLFNAHQLSAESSLQPNPSLPVRTISEIITSLRYFSIHETPLNMNLADIYKKDPSDSDCKWNLLPASEGEDSINEEVPFQPTFKWLSDTLIDSNLLEIDTIECKKIEKGKVPPEWIGHKQLIIINTSKKIYLKQEVRDAENIIKKRFDRYNLWLKFKRVKEIYFKGKPSLLLKFGDENSSSFAYYNLYSKSHRQQLGENCELFRVVENNLRETSRQKKWVPLYFRKLPLNMTKEQIMSVFKNSPVAPLWVEEPIQIGGYKYALGKVQYLDEALEVCAIFNSKKIRDSRVNIHPKSSKNWKAQESAEDIALSAALNTHF